MPADATHLPAPPLIELDHASVMRGARLALRDVSLRIPLGRHTAILGPNGCGKSTLIKLITRELYPLAHDDGRHAVRILGMHLWDVREIRTQLGIVTGAIHDDLASLPGLRVEDVVLGAFEARLAAPEPQTVTASMRDRAREALARVDALPLAEREYATLSTGEARRVLVARALVHAPRALLLDEPTTGLDLVARHRLLQTLRALARDGITLVLVTHHLEELIPEINHIVLLSEGQVLDDGPREHALTAERLSQAFGAILDYDDREYASAVVIDAVTRPVDA
ncbi:ABC transporter ATP-binding protein [Luteimonas panaciterrae]|uniref:ABC transporter ATP-binding protein n=1 Tax=Luteimonas panaciterrae TaxID=363885 RepID=UPI001CFB1D72|nr:ATP-binding cassette domain-containing protein [Luteimonas panaciterrae]